MIVCIIVRKSLLTGLQTLRGRYGSAISHVKNGVNIISSTRESTSPQVMQSPVPCVSLETLKAIFARLDYQSNQVIPLQL